MCNGAIELSDGTHRCHMSMIDHRGTNHEDSKVWWDDAGRWGEKRNASPSTGRKDDDGKTRFHLLPWFALEQLGKVLTYGAKKYSDNGWRDVTDWRSQYSAALLRHIVAWQQGEKMDPESGLHHLAHAAACVFILLERELMEKAP